MTDRQPTKPGRIALTDEQTNVTKYYTMEMADEPTDVGTPPTKVNLFSDATASKYPAGTETVDGALGWLGNYAQYRWDRSTYEAAWTYVFGVEKKRTVITSQYTVTFQYSDTISIDNSGNASMVNPTTGTYTYSDATTNLAVVRGKFFMITSSTGGSDQGKLLHAGSSAEITTESGSSNRYVYIMASDVNTNFGKYGEWQTLYSNNPNAYPHGGISGGYEYLYFGMPFENSVKPARIETGSYVGTGTYGAKNPCSITFGFTPKLVIMTGTINSIGTYSSNFNTDTRYKNIIDFEHIPTGYTSGIGLGDTGYSTLFGKKYENTLYWYHTRDSSCQSNTINTTYLYLAIG